MSAIWWSVAAALGFGIFQTLHRKAGEKIDAIRSTFILITVSSLLMIVIALFSTDTSLLQNMPLTAILAFAAAGFVHFFVGWTLIGISQKQIGAARTSATLGTLPLFGLVVDLLLYGESFSLPALLGMGLVVAGVYIISMR